MLLSLQEIAGKELGVPPAPTQAKPAVRVLWEALGGIPL